MSLLKKNSLLWVSPNGWRVSEAPFMGILASAVQPSVSRSDASLSIPRLLEIRSFHFWLKPLFTFCSSLRATQPPAVSQNVSRFIGTSEASFWLTAGAQATVCRMARDLPGCKAHDRGKCTDGASSACALVMRRFLYLGLGFSMDMFFCPLPSG